MKITILILILSTFVSACDYAIEEQAADDLLIGSWKNVDHENSITFDAHHNFTVKFSSHTAFSFNYYLDERGGLRQVNIYDSLFEQSYKYEFLAKDLLKMYIISPNTQEILDSGIYTRFQ
ncbi:hypothetical protein OKW21_002237 [Catalinimonas alkaloidigena]|uniref:hypothetical protein n=1 Tax=Catalinimonas alkaloidigena TaxID=1075417 RepID=UPI002405F12A|nr:hypothetical protein [Catalinimonas alkaloidigena]MDF9796974.1 hypothetical protein [Catalinimonas alkaloidigena]